MEFKGDSSWFLVSDDGNGMSSEELNEAMRFGTKREYDDDELGKFGLGLKTASISQCRRLTVASRNRDPNSNIEIRQLNLDHIRETDRWEIQSIPASDYTHILSDPLYDQHGTVILWEKLDRMMTYDPPDGMRAQKGFLKMARDLEEHLSMVFHRFLSGELGPGRKVVIKIGGEPISPWDPFARDENNLFKFREKTIAVPGADRPFNAHYTAYLLPTKAQFSTLSAWKRASGPNDWNFQQGFYIYREDRLIQSGGWNRMRTQDEHTKYARIALDLHADADFTLALNIMKSSVVFPPVMKALLKETVDELCSLARKKYTPDNKDRGNATNQNQTQSSSSLNSASDNINPQNFAGQERRENKSEPSKVSSLQISPEPNPVTSNSKGVKNFNSFFRTRRNGEQRTLGESLEIAASEIGESVALNKIKEFLKRTDPETANSIGW